jgi:hypothetical protein
MTRITQLILPWVNLRMTIAMAAALACPELLEPFHCANADMIRLHGGDTKTYRIPAKRASGLSQFVRNVMWDHVALETTRT